MSTQQTNKKFALHLDYENRIDVNEICKKLIKAYWSVCLIITAAAIIIFIQSLITGDYHVKHPGRPFLDYIMHFIVLQAVYLSAIIIAASIAIKHLGKKNQQAYQSFVCIIAMILISVVITITNHTIGGIFISFAFACFVALSFVDRKPIILSAAGGGIAYLLTFIFFLSQRAAQGEIIHRMEEVIGMMAFLGSSAAIAFFTLGRNKILINNVEKEAEKNDSIIGIIRETSETLHSIGDELSENMAGTTSEVNEINSHIQSIKLRIVNQSTSVKQTTASMEQITANLNKLNESVEIQAGSVANSSASIEEMLANIQSVTDTLVKNTENMEILMKASEVGRSGLQEVTEKIHGIAKESEGLLEINAVLQNIASQTNLLSMNAAIEAAHAGEAGRGFAVVADEIRKLAENSSEQSKTISTVLKKMKASIDSITDSTNKVLDKFEAIDSNIKTVADQEEHIRNAMEEQGHGSKQVLEAIDKLKDITIQVKNGSLEMLEGSKEVIVESKNLEKTTLDISEKMNDIALGADHINDTIQLVSRLSTRNKESINSLSNDVSHLNTR
ncbi:MAG: methyl-accepting chemotaxis protein [Spirochaetes bacterium]|nr:methyl-accepting chemotaxis protein [Spirochaetota bacterium]